MDTNIMLRTINFIVIWVILLLPLIFALISLKKRRLPRKSATIWFLVILFFPFLGPVALWTINPQNKGIEQMFDPPESSLAK
jgi:hypothetical protein